MKIVLNPEECWRAVLERSSLGTFVYAVRSTGVYCRPTCPSRRPRRENVEFFERPEGAEGAGFRACLRCRPNSAEPGAAMVERARRYIEDRLEDAIDLRSVATAAGASPFHLHRLFKRIVGATPKQYIDALRLSRVKHNLREGEPVASAAYGAGYGSSSRLYERAPERLGMTPAVYARGGAGETIRFTVATCALGRMMVAATDRGICKVSLGDSGEALERELREEFPGAEIQRDAGSLAHWAGQILRHIGGEEVAANLPLAVRATAFHCRVWEELRKTPRGETRTYADVARSLGRPRAVRAVANACAANPVAVLIPCHRVVRSDGAVGGYRWGIGRKEKLLAMERNNVP